MAAEGEPGDRTRFVPVPEAIDCLRPGPMSEPAVAYLSGAEERGAYRTYGEVAGAAVTLAMARAWFRRERAARRTTD